MPVLVPVLGVVLVQLVQWGGLVQLVQLRQSSRGQFHRQGCTSS